MIKPDENPKPVNLEGEREENQEEVLAAAQPDNVVRGVNGSLTPKARKLRPLAGIILIALVVLAAAYMRHGLANRHKKTVKQTETQKVGAGPATTVEKGLLSDQARSGLNTGQTHVPDSSALRTSILTGETPAGRPAQPGAPGNSSKTTSIPPLEYRQTPVTTAANGSLSYAEQRRLDEYNREREAMEAPTSVKGNLPGTSKETASTSSDPLAAIQSALLNARSMLGGGTGSSPQSALAQAGTTGTAEQRSDYDRQNDQEQKAAFGQQHSKRETEYLTATREAPKGQYEVKAGWLIPAVLEQQLNSDLPGMIRALVRENVYDSATGRYILIPSGSTLIGVYNSHVGYGQNALQAVWRRIVFPDGSSLALGGFEGDDSAGAAGFRDQVNNHWGRLLSGALMTSRLRRRYRGQPGNELLGPAIAKRRPDGGTGSWPASRRTRHGSHAPEPEHPAHDCRAARIQVLREGREGREIQRPVLPDDGGKRPEQQNYRSSRKGCQWQSRSQ